MSVFYDAQGVTLHVGHVLDVLGELRAGSVQTCITSPPYWGLRAYGTDPVMWGGDSGCAHQWATVRRQIMTGGNGTASAKQVSNAGSQLAQAPCGQGACAKCGSYQCELGSEPIPDCLAWARGAEPCSVCYVCHLVTVFRAVRRVLHDTGTCWVNLGDSYANDTKWGGSGSGPDSKNYRSGQGGYGGQKLKRQTGLGPKQLMGIPWRVALALQADGWVLRSDIIWAKKAPMPESVRDRPTNATEHVFLLAKNSTYFYDAEVVRQPLSDVSRAQIAAGTVRQSVQDGTHHPLHAGTNLNGIGINLADKMNPAGANLRNFWLLGPEPYSAAHFATYPTKLVEPCVLAGTSARGQCPACGAPWIRDGHRPASVLGEAVRVCREAKGWTREQLAAATGKGSNNVWDWEVGGHIPTGEHWQTLATALDLPFTRDQFVEQAEYIVTGRQDGPKRQAGDANPLVKRPYAERKLRQPSRNTEWAPTCRCNAGDPVPQTVLDPFSGSGTTLYVARHHGRRAAGIELNPDYAALAVDRLKQGTLGLELW